MLAIVQARMSSRRLPGKVLRPLAGIPMLRRVVDRVAASPGISRVVLATSVDASDDAVAAFCRDGGIVCHRGPLDDVGARFVAAAEAEGVDAFVRITGDSPLMDAAIVGEAAALYRTGDWDLVTNVLVRSFPIGQSVEVLRLSTFKAMQDRIADPAQREHVTQFYYAHPAQFRILGFTGGGDAAAVQLSVDTPEDFAAAERLIEKSDGLPGGWRDLVALSQAAA
jgi:spore coat polysaccharide biosynthesis protein SpsF